MLTTALSKTSVRAVYLTAEDLRIAASILYQAYVDDPLFRSIFQVEKQGYETRLRATIREELYTFWLAKEKMIGLFSDERLLAVTCVTHVTGSSRACRLWHWRLRMLLTAGFFSTRELLNKEKTISELIPFDDYHMISFIAVQPNHQHVGLGHHLMSAIDKAVSGCDSSNGASVFVTIDDYEQFFADGGYSNIGGVDIKGIQGKVLFKDRNLMESS